jgi:hypothetical protein
MGQQEAAIELQYKYEYFINDLLTVKKTDINKKILFKLVVVHMFIYILFLFLKNLNYQFISTYVL